MIKVFNENLTVCAPNADSMSKLIIILASPLRTVLTSWVTFGVGLEIFTIQGIQDMNLARCSTYFVTFFDELNKFYGRIMSDIPTRYFDLRLQEALAKLQSRNASTLSDLSWPEKGKDCAMAPPGRKRNNQILPYVNDDQYHRIYNRLCERPNMEHTLMTKKDFQTSLKWGVPAVRCVVSQASRWLMPAIDKEGDDEGRFSAKKDFAMILASENFTRSGFHDPQHTAEMFVGLLIQTALDYSRDCNAKHVPEIDSYPNIQSANSKKKAVTVTAYLKRFRTMYAWFHIAKLVAWYTRYQVQELFMKVFNNPVYSVSVPAINVAMLHLTPI